MNSEINIFSTKKLNCSIASNAARFGFRFIEYDFIEINILAEAAQAKAIEKCNQNIIFTSANAVNAYREIIEKYALKIPAKNVYCLEEATLEAAGNLSNATIISSAKNAETLARLILSQKDMGPMSFFCGNKRRAELPSILKSGNIAVDEIVLYNAVARHHAIKEAYDGILFFSPGAVESFFQANYLPGNIPCFCIGHTTMGALRQYSNNTILVAAASSQAAVIDCAQTYFKGQKSNIKNQ